MRIVTLIALALVAAGCGRSNLSPKAAKETAMTATPQHSPEALSLARVQPRQPGAVVEIVTDALGADGSMDLRHSAYGNNLSPPLRWTPVEGAGSYALILEDPDAAGVQPIEAANRIHDVDVGGGPGHS